MPINVTVNTMAELIAQIRQVNQQPNNVDQHVITLGASFPTTAQISSAASGAGGDADLFGLCAFPVIRRNLKIVGNGKTLAMNGIFWCTPFRNQWQTCEQHLCQAYVRKLGIE